MRSFLLVDVLNGSTINLKKSINGPTIVSEVVLPTFNNVQPNFNNNQLIYNIGGGDVITPITSGFYTDYNALITEVNTKLSASSALFSVSIDSNSLRTTISHTSNFSIDDNKLLNNMLGFESGAINGTTTSYTSTYPINIAPYNNILLYVSPSSITTHTDSSISSSITIPVANYNYYDKLCYSIDKNAFEYDEDILRMSNTNVSRITARAHVKFSSDDDVAAIDFGQDKISLKLMYYYT